MVDDWVLPAVVAIFGTGCAFYAVYLLRAGGPGEERLQRSLQQGIISIGALLYSTVIFVAQYASLDPDEYRGVKWISAFIIGPLAGIASGLLPDWIAHRLNRATREQIDFDDGPTGEETTTTQGTR